MNQCCGKGRLVVELTRKIANGVHYNVTKISLLVKQNVADAKLLLIHMDDDGNVR